MKLAIFGYGGHAREVEAQMGKKVVFFVDDEYAKKNILPISKFDPNEFEIMIAVAESEERKKIVERLPAETKYFSFIHPTAQIMSEDVFIGVGSFIGANTILTTNIRIGNHCILNRGNQIGHDCVIGDYFSAMPGAIISGNVTIGDCCYLGTNSTIIEKKNILSKIKIGAGATVVKDLNEIGTYVGTPTHKIK